MCRQERTLQYGTIYVRVKEGSLGDGVWMQGAALLITCISTAYHKLALARPRLYCGGCINRDCECSDTRTERLEDI